MIQLGGEDRQATRPVTHWFFFVNTHQHTATSAQTNKQKEKQNLDLITSMGLQLIYPCLKCNFALLFLLWVRLFVVISIIATLESPRIKGYGFPVNGSASFHFGKLHENQRMEQSIIFHWPWLTYLAMSSQMAMSYLHNLPTEDLKRTVCH